MDATTAAIVALITGPAAAAVGSFQARKKLQAEAQGASAEAVHTLMTTMTRSMGDLRQQHEDDRAAWREEISSLRARIGELEVRIASREARIAELESEIVKLATL